VGSAGAAVWVRWRATGLIVFFFLIGVLLIGALALVGLTDNWPAVGNFLGAAGAFGIALWLLVPAVVSALAGYFILRRATPRS
jgi:hypothetical protein